jgi:ketosteroid isomerase-like protein
MTIETRAADTQAREVQQFVADWYAALDRHVPFAEVAEYLDGERVRFVFPEVVVDSVEGLRQWYERVTRTFFDEAHRVDVADVTADGDGGFAVHVVVNWTTRVWEPPAPASSVLSYDADQSWLVVRRPDGRLGLRDYVVDGLQPVGDTPAF